MTIRICIPATRNLEWLRDSLGERFIVGFVIHTGDDTFPLSDNIWAVPVADPC